MENTLNTFGDSSKYKSLSYIEEHYWDLRNSDDVIMQKKARLLSKFYITSIKP